MKLKNIKYDINNPKFHIYMKKYKYYMIGGRKTIDLNIQKDLEDYINIFELYIKMKRYQYHLNRAKLQPEYLLDIPNISYYKINDKNILFLKSMYKDFFKTKKIKIKDFNIDNRKNNNNSLNKKLISKIKNIPSISDLLSDIPESQIRAKNEKSIKKAINQLTTAVNNVNKEIDSILYS